MAATGGTGLEGLTRLERGRKLPSRQGATQARLIQRMRPSSPPSSARDECAGVASLQN